MVCAKCGAEVIPGTKFCSQCGTPVTAQDEASQPQSPAANHASIEEPSMTQIFWVRPEPHSASVSSAADAAPAAAPTPQPSRASAAPAPQPSQASAAVSAASAGNVCPSCGTLNTAGVRFCKGCGAAMQAAPTVTSSAAVSTGGQICSSCGTMNNAGVRFCRNCGASLNSSSYSGTPPYQVATSGISCPGCGTVNTAGVRFCKGCGQPLNSAPTGSVIRNPAPVNNGPTAAPGSQVMRTAPGNSSSTVAPGNSNRTVVPGNRVTKTAPGNNKRAAVPGNGGRKSVPWKLIIIIAAVIVALAALFVVCKFVLGNGSGSVSEVSDELFFITDSDNVLHIGNPDGEFYTMSLEDYYFYNYPSADGSAALLSLESNDPDVANELYYIADESVELIAEDTAGRDLSADGSTVVYLIPNGEDGETGDLFLYSNGSSTELDSDVYRYMISLSADGKSVGYVKDYSPDDEVAYHGYYYDGSKIQELGKNRRAVAFSDNAKYVYFERKSNDGDIALYAQKGDNTDNAVKLSSDVTGYFLNQDGTEIMIHTGAGKTKLSVNGKEATTIASDYVSPVVPYGTAIAYDGSWFGISSFAGMYYSTAYTPGAIDYSTSSYCYYGNVYYLNSKLETDHIVTAADSVYVSANGKTIYYLDNGVIRSINGTKKNAKSEILADDDITIFQMTEDGHTLFYLTEDDELYAQTGKKDPVLVCDDPDGLIGIFQGKTLYYIYDNELYSSTGSHGELAVTLEEDVEGGSADSCILRIYCEDSDDNYVYYVCGDGKHYTLIG